jgi:cytochrome c peroxidase
VFEGLGRGTRNTPSLWNVAYQRWFFWDGRVDSLWAQAAQPIENAIELGGDRAQVARLFAGDPTLRASYEELFGALPDLTGVPEHARPVAGEPQNPEQRAWAALDEARQRALTRVIANAGKALEAYERKLVRRDAPFDRFVAALDKGDRDAANAALSDSAQRGLQLFIGKGNCRLCHGGASFSDGEFHNIGVPPLGGGLPTDGARYDGVARVKADALNAAGEFSDAREGERALQLRTLVQSPQNFGEWRTPSLRNVALSPPYMHQGQFASLRDVLHFYSTLEGATQVGHHQEQVLKPLQLEPQEIEDLVAFLESLTGDPPPRAWLEAPRE